MKKCKHIKNIKKIIKKCTEKIKKARGNFDKNAVLTPPKLK